LLFEAEEILEQALAAPVQEPVAWLHPANATCVTTDPTAYARGIPLYTTPPAAQPAPVQEGWKLVPLEPTEAMAGLLQWFDRGSPLQISKGWREVLSAAPPAPAPVQEPVAKYIGECSEGSLVQLYEDVKKGTEFYTTQPAQPAVPDAIHHTDLSESLEYIQGWNDCRAEMLKGMKP
jgi:hypothetical protein